MLQGTPVSRVVAETRPGARRTYLRWSPHFYNTEDELDRAVGVLRDTGL